MNESLCTFTLKARREKSKKKEYKRTKEKKKGYFAAITPVLHAIDWIIAHIILQCTPKSIKNTKTENNCIRHEINILRTLIEYHCFFQCFNLSHAIAPHDFLLSFSMFSLLLYLLCFLLFRFIFHLDLFCSII